MMKEQTTQKQSTKKEKEVKTMKTQDVQKAKKAKIVAPVKNEAPAKKEIVKDTIKKEFPKEPVAEKCPTCGGKDLHCTHCGGSGWLRLPKKARVIGRSTAGTASNITKKETTKAIKVEVIHQEIKFKSFNHGKDTYFISKDVALIEDLGKDITPEGEIEDCMDKLLKPYYKRLGVDTIKGILGNVKSVQGVRYKVDQNCEKISLSGKLQGTSEYVKSGLKLSTQVWIDSKYLQIFNTHRFVYLNPNKEGEFIPVLCINKLNNKVEGLVMPLAK